MSIEDRTRTLTKIDLLQQVQDRVEIAGIRFSDIHWDMEHNLPAIKVEKLTLDIINELNKVGLLCSVSTGFGPPGSKVWYRYSVPYLLVERIKPHA